MWPPKCCGRHPGRMPPNLQSEVQIPQPPTHPVAMSGSSSRLRKSPRHGSKAGHRRRQALAWAHSLCHRSNSARRAQRSSQRPPPFCPLCCVDPKLQEPLDLRAQGTWRKHQTSSLQALLKALCKPKRCGASLLSSPSSLSSFRSRLRAWNQPSSRSGTAHGARAACATKPQSSSELRVHLASSRARPWQHRRSRRSAKEAGDCPLAHILDASRSKMIQNGRTRTR